MRRILTGFALALVGMSLTTGGAQAQGGGGGGGRGGARMIEALFQGITLTEAQTTQRDSIAKAFQAQMPAFTQGTPPSAEDRAKRMELMGKQQEAFKAILTDEQKKVFEKSVETLQSQRRPPPQR